MLFCESVAQEITVTMILCKYSHVAGLLSKFEPNLININIVLAFSVENSRGISETARGSALALRPSGKW